jgi:hypothetical protein
VRLYNNLNIPSESSLCSSRLLLVPSAPYCCCMTPCCCFVTLPAAVAAAAAAAVACSLLQGLSEHHDNYHEFCRLLGRLKSNYQLSELVSTWTQRAYLPMCGCVCVCVRVGVRVALGSVKSNYQLSELLSPGSQRSCVSVYWMLHRHRPAGEPSKGSKGTVSVRACVYL